jgi:Uma2 family endonuclease
VATANLGIVRDWSFGAPDVLIEVVSPDGVERDRLVKRRLYAENSVRE